MEHTIYSGCRTCGFCVLPGREKLWICLREIRLFVCRWCGEAERILIEILVVELHHRGSKRYITLPSHRSDTSKKVAPILEIFEMLRVISSEKTLQFYYCNRTQFA